MRRRIENLWASSFAVYLYAMKGVTEMNEKRSERRKHCAPAAVPPPHRRTESAMAVVRQNQNFPRRRPLPGGAGPPKFNQLEMVTTCTYRSSLVKIDARNFELSW